ncbi:MAG: gliding motility-associated protein GldE [Ferruginibacter sp.]
MDYHSVMETGIFSFPFLFISIGGVTVLIFLAVLLFILSFLVAGSEIAFFSLTPKEINILKTRRQPSFRRIAHLMEHPQTLLASLLITNVFANIGAILISSLLIDDWMMHIEMNSYLKFIVKIVSISFLLVLFVEVLPKVWATHHKLWFAATASLTIEIFSSVFYGFSRRLVRFNDNIESKLSTHTKTGNDKRNLDYAIDLLPDHEASDEEKQILKGIRKFGDIEVKQIMRTRLDVSGIGYNCSFEDLIKKVEELHYSRLPVYKSNLDEIAGILHTKDLLPYLGKSTDFDWHTLVRTAFFVHEQKLIDDLLQEFRNKRIHFAVVVDEFGGTSGIVTLEDIMEEVIGEIKDEFDDEESINKKLDDHNYIFEGKLMINDACKAMSLPTDTFDGIRGESDSMAGLLLEIAGEFPEVNETLVSGDFTFIPLEIKKNRIDKIKVTIHPNEA